MHRFPIRFQDNRWQIQVPGENGELWVDCGNEKDCRQMSLSGNLAFDAIERVRSGPELADELEASATLFRRYGCAERAMWLEEHAKLARGEPTIFDYLN